MRLRLGRPDIDAYADRFDVAPATDRFGVTFLGVSSLLFDDGEHALMTDGFFSRPSLARVGLGKVAPDEARIGAALGRLRLDGEPRLRAVLPVHTHFDHAMDSAVVAERTGAVLVGGRSAAHVGAGAGLTPERIRNLAPHQPMTFGSFEVTAVLSAHCPPDRYPGAIAEPLVPPVRAAAYRCGEAWSLVVGHTSGRTALVQGSAGFVPGALDDRRADVVFLGVGQLGVLEEQYIRDYWRHTVQAVGAKEVVLVHWDDFFRPLDQPLRALPYAGDDLDATLRVLGRLADDQGVGLHLPTVWRREDPWPAPH
jgi:L-ascorbate metabolism protein UlaG (beta-lactamase superfamily)